MPLFIELTSVFEINGHGWIDKSLFYLVCLFVVVVLFLEKLLFVFCFVFNSSLSLVGFLGRLTWIRLQQPQEQCHPYLPACAAFSCVQTMVWLAVFGIFFTHMQMLMHATAYRGCTNTVREFALEVEVETRTKILVIPGNQSHISFASFFILFFNPTLCRLFTE